MASHRDAARLVLRTTFPFRHQSNGTRTPLQLPRAAFQRKTANSSPRWTPSSYRPITSAAKRTSQQAAAARKNDEPEEPEEQPSINAPDQPSPETTKEGRARIAQDFLTGPAPRPGQGQPSPKPPQRPRNPLRDNDGGNTQHGFTPTDISPEISERFSFLRNTRPPPAPLGQANDGKTASAETRENTLQTLLSAFNQHRNAQGQPPARKSNNRADASRLLAPRKSEPAGLDLVRTYAEPDLSPPSFKLGPRLPRTVEVNQKRGVDLMRAFKTMEVRLISGSVKSDMFKQRFHERTGLKRKRLASERWRRRFKDNIIETVKRIHEIRKQGW